MLQVDFANKYVLTFNWKQILFVFLFFILNMYFFLNRFIGGGVLGWGCVQEEIRFVVCPELIVSRLFTECLDATEALLMVGCERFNVYSGYGHSFEWVGDYKDDTPLDSAGRRHCSIVAMDALCFSNTSSQYTVPNLAREVNKVGKYYSMLCSIA